MNQFKQAKQKLIAQGKEVEHITDLKTAGVKSAEADKEITKEIKEETFQAQNNIEINEPATDVETQEAPQKAINEEQTIINVDEISNEINKETIPQIENESKIPIAVPAEEKKVISQPIIEKEIIEPVIHSTASVIVSEESKEQIVENQQINNIISTPAPQYQQPVPHYITYTEVPVQQPVTQKAQTTKKNIPNIFAPKEEPKSMRKSLVLKPTSVKKAESYCSKNGGSFNELVQTLLDNFIKEYGL